VALLQIGTFVFSSAVIPLFPKVVGIDFGVVGIGFGVVGIDFGVVGIDFGMT